MLPPQKPWENAALNQRMVPPSLNSDGMPSSSNIGSAGATQYMPPQSAPPLPPRPRRSHSIQNRYGLGYGGSSYYNSSFPYGSYGGGGYNSYGSYGGYNSYGGYGGYSSYGGYDGYGPNRFGFRSTMPESRFIQMAEDGTRPAFQSIESLVHAFGSVSFMLESTFNAMYSSFRAVLGVAENFGRLRALFGQFLSVFAIFRWFQWLYRKCLYLLGLSSRDPGQDALWRQASNAVVGGQMDPAKERTSWPILVFLGIILSGPYLMWKLLSSIDVPNVDPYSAKDWPRFKEPILTAVALYDFTASNGPEMSFRAGQRIFIAPKDCQQSQSWLLATTDCKNVGLVPSNYVKILGRTAFKSKSKNESPINSVVNEEPKVNESNGTENQEPISVSHIPGPSDKGLVQNNNPVSKKEETT